MIRARRARPTLIATLVAAVALAGCEWQDVTGARSEAGAVGVIPRAAVATPAPVLLESQAIEEVIATLQADHAELTRRLQGHAGNPAELQRRLARTDSVLERLSTVSGSGAIAVASPSQDAALMEEGEAPRIIDAKTLASIDDAGASSSGRVVSFTELSRTGFITHTVEISVLVDGAPRLKQTVTMRNLNTVSATRVPVNGLDCTRKVELKGTTRHEVESFLIQGNPALSFDDAGCGPPCPVNNPRQIQQPASVSYDPYATSPSDCGGTGGDGGGGSGSNCRLESVRIEVSHDGGDTWTTYLEGTATVCD